MANLSEPDKPNYTRPEAQAVRPDLDLISDLLAGTRRMWEKSRERRYIRKWSDEKPEVYELRRQCESVFEGLARVLSAAVGMLWAKMPVIEWNAAEEAMAAQWADLDGAGTAGPVLCKRFTDQAIRDGIGLILVDHPNPPKDIAVITDAVAQEFNLRPTWALYARSQILSWRVGKINNRATPVQVVLEECVYPDAGAYGMVERKRYRVLRLLTRAVGVLGENDPGGPMATWELYEESKDGSVVGGFKSIDKGVFRNRGTPDSEGELATSLPIGIAYTGRTDAPFCASIPLLGVAFANLSHWQLSTELRFGRSVAAIEQPVVVGELMGHHPSELVIVGLQKQPRGDIELSPAAVGRVDVGIVHDRHPNLIQGARMIHRCDEREHDAPEALGLLRIERARRGLGSASLLRLTPRRTRRAHELDATRDHEAEEEGAHALCVHDHFRTRYAFPEVPTAKS